MATYVPAKKNTAHITYIDLVSQADTKLLQVNPTIASGDFKVSIDGGSYANLSTLPVVTPAGGATVKISLSSSEMNGDNIHVLCVDAAGAEWCSLGFNIQTAARQIDDLAYPATSGRSMVVDASGLVDANAVKVGPTGSGTAQTARDIGASVLLSSGSGTGQLDFTSGVVKANATQWLGGTIPTVNVTGVPLVDAKYLLGTIFSTPTVAGIPNVNAKTWNDLATVELPLVPTTAGRKLDVSTGGEAGLDWNNIGSPTTVVALSGTTVKTATDVEADTQDIQSRLPAALVSGRIDASVGAMAANTLTASALATDAVTEIQSGLGTGASLTNLQTDVDDIQSRLPAALVGGRMDSSTGAMAANTMTASALAADAVTEIQTGAPDTAGVSTLLSRLSAARAGYLDNLSGGAVALASGVTLTAGQIAVKKNTALSNFPFPMFDQTTGAGLAGLTVTATRSIDGGAFASCANSPSEIGSGAYKISLAAADVNGATVIFRFSATGAKDTFVTVVPQP